MTVDCNARYVNADPERGTQMAVSEAARNIVVSGGIPSAVTNCLNFGNPYNPEVYWQFVGAIKGMSKACLKFETPVTGGNVSFYNQSLIDGKEITVLPTPTIGMIGVVEDIDKLMTLDFKSKGDLIFLVGESVDCIASSEYLVSYHGIEASPAPHFDLDKEFALQETIKSLIAKQQINAAHDCADGGLFIALTEMSMPNGLGFDILTDSEVREDAFLFGEAQSRVVVTVTENQDKAFMAAMAKQNVPYVLLGHVTKGKICVDEEHYGFINEMKDVFDNSLGNAIEA
jgi:phosphoribosylformylglycinamidine synthase